MCVCTGVCMWHECENVCMHVRNFMSVYTFLCIYVGISVFNYACACVCRYM